MSEETVTIYHYVVKKGMHLGPWRRDIRVDDIIEWHPETEYLKINGVRITEDKDMNLGEGMRQLTVLSEVHPDDPAIVTLEKQEEQEPQELSTSTLCVLPILGCIHIAEKYMEEEINQPPERAPVTDEQEQFLELFEDLLTAIPELQELQSMADMSAGPVNAWLKERGFDIELPEPDENGFAVASILDILVNWLHTGKRTFIKGVNTGEEYTGVHLNNGVTVAHLPAVHDNPVVRIATKEGYSVCMSMVDNVPEGITGLFLKVAELEQVKATSHHFDGVQFPMIDLDEKPDISWINGLQFGQGLYVSSAMQQTKFRMNEKGARIESAAGMSIMRSMVSNKKLPHVIDKPFLLWVNKDGLDFPVFAGLLCEDVWKEPSAL
jgi:hypothetical protein